MSFIRIVLQRAKQDIFGGKMKEAKWFRKSNIIRGPEGDKVYQSINKAKKESRVIQAANGGLGCGVLRIVEKLPKS